MAGAKVIEIINILLPIYQIFAQKRFFDATHLPLDTENPTSIKQHEKVNKDFIWFLKNMKVRL